MRMWKVALLLNLALMLGVGGGYVIWGRRAERLERELALARAAALVTGVERQWSVRGVVRAFVPEANLVVITHEEIPGLMAPMTMGFRAATSHIYDGVGVGDEVRLTLRGVPPDVVVTALERIPPGGRGR
jgi:Cu/Ag efflux protein CusF